MKKKIFLPSILALSVLTISILATNVFAQDTNFYPPIVQKIADKFDLNISDVQKVFDEEADENNTSPEEELQYQIDKDKYKEEYARKMGYEYLIIPYWTEKDESYKSLIDKKIENILN